MTTADFDARAETWDDDPAKVERARAVAEEIVARVPLSRTMRALEYGCGTGLLSFMLRERLGDITLADVPTACLRSPRARSKRPATHRCARRSSTSSPIRSLRTRSTSSIR
jgi:predicted TPR repeat methyltransferase